MNDHAQYAEPLALYALGTLEDGQERADLETHLERCAECRGELELLRADTARLAFSAFGPMPPQRSRARLIEAIQAEPRRSAASQRMIVGVLHPRWLATAPIAATLMLAIFSLMLWREDVKLRRNLDRTQAELQSQKETLARAQAVMDLLHAPDAHHMILVEATQHPQPQVKMIYAPKKGGLLLMASMMETLPPSRVYELWLLPMGGGAPMPCGTFKPDTQGNAMMQHNLPPGTEAKGFAVTVESEG